MLSITSKKSCPRSLSLPDPDFITGFPRARLSEYRYSANASSDTIIYNPHTLGHNAVERLRKICGPLT